jgi:hypothetical protein
MFLFFGQNNWGKFGKFSLSSLNATNFANLWMEKKKKKNLAWYEN